jgi:hypothetical protein
MIPQELNHATRAVSDHVARMHCGDSRCCVPDAVAEVSTKNTRSPRRRGANGGSHEGFVCFYLLIQFWQRLEFIDLPAITVCPSGLLHIAIMVDKPC